MVTRRELRWLARRRASGKIVKSQEAQRLNIKWKYGDAARAQVVGASAR
jgi:hypothetical protein